MEKIPWDKAIENYLQYLYEQNFKRLAEIEELEKEMQSLKQHTEKSILETKPCLLETHQCEIDCLGRARIMAVEGECYLYTYTDLGRSIYYKISYCPMCGEKLTIDKKT